MKRNDIEDKAMPLTFLFTLSTLIWSVRKIFVEEYGFSDIKIDTVILIVVGAEKQINKLDAREKL